MAVATSSGTFTDNASISADQFDPNSTNNVASGTVTVTNGPGTLQFSAPSYTFSETARTAQVTIVRASGNLGAVTVNYATADGTGVAGTNYTAVSGTLTFAAGQLSQTINVPILDDGVVNGNKTVNLALSSPGGGASLGSPSTATLILTEGDFDVTGPQVTNVQPVGAGRLSGVTITFSEPLDPARATNPANFALYGPTKAGGLAPVAILPPTYDASTNTVTITAAQPLALNTNYRLVVNGSSTSGVADIYDNLLQGSGSNGTDFGAYFARGTALRYTDHDGDHVSLNLKGAGYLDLYRLDNGEGQTLTVVGGGRGRSVLSGSVRKGAAGSDGVTTFAQILGAGFGQVNSRLTTGPFYVSTVTALIKTKSKGASAAIAHATPAHAVPSLSAKFFARAAKRTAHR